MERARWGQLGLDLAQVRQQRAQFREVLGQRALLALHLRDQDFELDNFDREAPGQLVLLAHRPRLALEWLADF
jgi:hypothetical protein